MDVSLLSFLPLLKDLLSNPLKFFGVVLLIATFIRFCFLLIHYVGHYWKLVRAFRNFPSCHLDVKLIWRIIFGFYPRDVPFSNVLFQIVLKEGRRYEKEGICIFRFIYPVLFVFNEDFCKKLSSEPEIVDKSIIYSLANDILGNGILTSKAKVWKIHRKLLNPAFSRGTLKGKVRIFNENAEELVQKLQEVSGKPTVQVIDFFKIQAFNNLAESILGVKLNDEKYGSKIVNYCEAIERFTEVLVYRLARPWLYWNITMPLFSKGREYMKICDDLQIFTQEILRETKKSLRTSSVSEGVSDINREGKKSFVRILIEEHLKDPNFTLKDIQDHLNTMMASGHDTASYALMWCIYLLGHHPQVQEKAFGETQSIKERDVTYEDLCGLSYLECVMKETVRLYPIVPFYGRKLSKDIRCGEYTMPKGADVIFFAYLLHRNPKLYEDPDTFRPERFSEASNIRPWTFLSFGEGNRDCIGKMFAMMEMKVLLVHILRRFQIKTLDKIEEKDLDWTITLKPVKPARIVFTVRE